MSNPSFQIAKSKLEDHLIHLIGQPIEEFQEKWDVKIKAIDIGLIDVSTSIKPHALIHKFKITVE
jgi:hypothetical protein